MTTKQPEALAQECADYATSLRSAANVAKLEGRAPPVSFLRAADLFERAASRITELESRLAQRFDAADMATAAAQGFRDGVASLSANAGEPRNAIDRDALIDAIAQGLHGTWHCTRVWEAWHVGTMSQDDFEPVDESETPTEIADAVLALLAAPPTAQAVVDRWDTPLWKDVPATAEYIGRLRAALAAGQATAAQAVVQDDLITIRKPTNSAEMLLLLKLAHLVISDVDKTLEESFAPAQPAAQQGVAYAALPESFLEIPDVQDESGINAYYSREVVLECIDAALASHGQAPAWATKPTEQQILEAAFAPAQPAAEASRFGSPELQAMIIARCVEKDQADSVQEDAADPLQGAANWLAEAHGLFSPVVLSGCLMIGYNRAKRLHDAALAARKQGANHDR